MLLFVCTFSCKLASCSHVFVTATVTIKKYAEKHEPVVVFVTVSSSK